MSHLPEDDELLDQTLRETFSDFDLTPSQHVWVGIEGRIGGLPSAARTLPLKFLLPAVALVGVGVGWLLPRPATIKIAPKAPVSALAQLPSIPETLATTVTLKMQTPVSGTAADTVPRPAVAALHRRALRPLEGLRPVPATKEATRLAPAEPLMPAQPAAQPAMALPALDSSLRLASIGTTSYDATPEAELSADTAVLLAPDNVVGKSEVQQEIHTEFRQPTHRMAERGRGIRRRLSSVTLWVRQVVNPRRARTTGQPSF